MPRLACFSAWRMESGNKNWRNRMDWISFGTLALTVIGLVLWVGHLDGRVKAQADMISKLLEAMRTQQDYNDEIEQELDRLAK